MVYTNPMKNLKDKQVKENKLDNNNRFDTVYVDLPNKKPHKTDEEAQKVLDEEIKIRLESGGNTHNVEKAKI